MLKALDRSINIPTSVTSLLLIAEEILSYDRVKAYSVE